MPAYRYRAVHGSGRIAEGVVTATNEIELAQFLGHAQMELIEAKENKPEPARDFGFGRQIVSLRALALLCTQIAELLKAGVPFPDVLADLSASMPVSKLRDALVDILRAINHGSGIAKAFARHPRMFTSVFIAILASGEASGDITKAFTQLAHYVEGRARFNEGIARALRYPLFLMVLAFCVVTFMMVLVVPQIIAFLQTIDSQLPTATRILIAVSNFFGAVWWMLSLSVLAAIGFIGVARRVSTPAAQICDGTLLRVPVIGKVIEKIVLARFVHCLSILVQSGLTIPESLQGARDTLGNHALMARLDVVQRQITSGRPLSSAMELLLPPFAVRILRLGEQGGQLTKALHDIGVTYDREAADSAERMIGMLEPGLTLLIGALLAWVVLAVLGPIYGSLSRMNMMG